MDFMIEQFNDYLQISVINLKKDCMKEHFMSKTTLQFILEA